MAKAKPKPPKEDEAAAEAAEDEGVNKPTSINANLDPDQLHLRDSRSE